MIIWRMSPIQIQHNTQYMFLYSGYFSEFHSHLFINLSLHQKIIFHFQIRSVNTAYFRVRLNLQAFS